MRTFPDLSAGLSGGVANWGPIGPAFQLQIKYGFDFPAAYLGQEPLTLMLFRGSRTEYFPNTPRTNFPEFLTFVDHRAASSHQWRPFGESARPSIAFIEVDIHSYARLLDELLTKPPPHSTDGRGHKNRLDGSHL